MDPEKIDPELRAQVLEYYKKMKEFQLNFFKKQEEMYERFLIIFDPKNRKKLNSEANRTRIVEKNLGKNCVMNSHQTRGYSKNLDSSNSVIDVAPDTSVRSTRRAAQIADKKNKNCLALNLNQKLRQPSTCLEVPAFKRNRGADVSPFPPTKYLRTKKKQSAGNSYDSAEVTPTKDFVAAEADSTSHLDVIEADEINKTPNRKIRKCYSNDANRTAIQINNVKLMAPNYVIKDSECFKQLTSVAVVNIEQQTNEIAISDSGISEEHHPNNEYYDENGLQIAKSSRIKVLKSSGEIKNHVVKTITSVDEANINIHHKEKETYYCLENKNSELNNRKKKCELSSEEDIKNLIVNEDNLNIVDQETNEIVRKPQTRTKVIKTSASNTNVINAVHENIQKQNTEEETSTVRTRTKVLKAKDNNPISDDSERETNKLRTRTKVLKTKDDNVISNTSDDSERETYTVQTRTIVLKTKNNNSFSDTSDDSERETDKIRTRTKVLKTKGIFSEASDNIETSKIGTRTCILKANDDVFIDRNVKQVPICKAYELPKSELVKKRVEEFEKTLDRNIPVENGSSRMTRTKTKALKTAASTDKIETPIMAEKFNHDIFEECEKENLQRDESSNHFSKGKREKGGTASTPLATHNRIGTPVTSNTNKDLFPNKYIRPAVIGIDKILIHNTPSRLEGRIKKEELSKKQKKTEEAVKKKEKTLKAASEKTRRRREEKLQKVAAARQAAEKEKAALALKLEKEKEERDKQIQLEKEKQKEEISRKKLITQQKLHEVEERRKLDEAARLAKIQEQELEQKRILANKQKEHEAAERHHQLRKIEELRIKEAENLKKNQKPHNLLSAKLENKIEKSSTYDITPHRDERRIIMPKTKNDYGIMDCHTDDSSEDEQRPKKKVPQWALAKIRNEDLSIQKYCLPWDSFVTCNPKPVLKEIFSQNELPSKRFHRTSSAIWATPPTY